MTVAVITGTQPPGDVIQRTVHDEVDLPPCRIDHPTDDPRVSFGTLECEREHGHDGDHWDDTDGLSWRVEAESLPLFPA
jgi:hypothetical protein